MHRVTMMADTSSTAPESNPDASECYREGGTVRQAAATRCSICATHGLRKISSETGSLTLAPDGIPVTSTRLFNANGLITTSGLEVCIP